MNQNVVAGVEERSGLVPMKSSSRGSAALGSKKVVTSGLLAMLQLRRRVVFTHGLLAGLDEFFKDGQSLLAADAVVGQYLPHVAQGLEHASPHSHGRQHQVRCRLALGTGARRGRPCRPSKSGGASTPRTRFWCEDLRQLMAAGERPKAAARRSTAG